MGRTSLAIAPSNPDVDVRARRQQRRRAQRHLSPGPAGRLPHPLAAAPPGRGKRASPTSDPSDLNTLLLTNVVRRHVQDCSILRTRQQLHQHGLVHQRHRRRSARSRIASGPAGVDWFRSDDGGRNWGLSPATAASGFAVVRARRSARRSPFTRRTTASSNQIAFIGNDGGSYRTDERARRDRRPGPRRPAPVSASRSRGTSLNRGYGVTQFYHGTPVSGRHALPRRRAGQRHDPRHPTISVPMGGGRSSAATAASAPSHPTQPQTWLVEFQWANLAQDHQRRQHRSAHRRTGSRPGRARTCSGPDANYLFVTPFTSRSPRIEAALDWRRLSLSQDQFRRRAVDEGQRSRACPMAGASAPSPCHRATAPSSSPVPTRATSSGRTNARSMRVSGNIQFTGTRPRDGWVTSVAFDPRADNTVYATYGNFGGAHVFRSADGGATWQGIDGAGDRRSARHPRSSASSSIRTIDQRLYLGTDLGVFVSIDGGQRVDDAKRPASVRRSRCGCRSCAIPRARSGSSRSRMGAAPGGQLP